MQDLPPKETWDETDFELLSWHDNYIHGLSLDTEGWNSDLIFDIDHITQWICGADGSCRFWIAPASLTFHDVTDLKLHVEWQESGFQVSAHEMSIHEIRRELVTEQKICFDRKYYKWTIEINWPQAGMISFGSTGFTQRLLKPPMLSDEQLLSPPQRRVQ